MNESGHVDSCPGQPSVVDRLSMLESRPIIAVFGGTFLLAVAAGLVGATATAAGDDAAPKPAEPSRFEQALEKSLGVTPREQAEPAGIVEIPQRMQQAAREMADGDLPDAIEHQWQVLAALDELLASASPQAAGQTGGSAAQEQPVGVSGNESNGPATGTGVGSEGAARESSSQSAGQGGGAVQVERRRNLATAVWGHLPDRVREEMLQSYSEEFLPEYEELVERYYEALAEQRLRSERPE